MSTNRISFPHWASRRYVLGMAVALGSLLAGGMEVPGGRSLVVAAETPVTEKSASSSTAEMRIEDWIKQLDAPEYGQRKVAAARLVEAGKPALPAVREAAHSSNREVSERALEILKRQFGSLDPQVKEAARLALEEMSRSETTRVASAARGILNPNAVPPAAAQLAKAQVLAAARARALQNAGVAPRIAINALPANGGRVISVTAARGQKRLQLREANRQVVITIDAQGEITMEITIIKDGKGETKKYSAKDEADLKEKHPEAHRIFEELKPHLNPVARPAMPGMPGLPGLPGQPGGIPGAVPGAVPGGVPAARIVPGMPAVPGVPMIPGAPNPPGRAIPPGIIPPAARPAPALPAVPGVPAIPPAAPQ